MSDVEKENFWKTLRDTGISFADLQGTSVKGGFFRTSEVGFGADNADMGFGKLGFFSERHIRMIGAMGAPDYARDIVSRRTNTGAVQTY
jgi:hypothetical protein